jgi:diguanylate cyclase (GGDEF)-like protein
MKNVLAGISKLLDAPAVELLKFEKGFDILRVAEHQGHDMDADKMRQVQIKIGEGMIGTCAEMKKLISKADVKKDFSMGNLTQHPLLQTEVVIPLVQGDDLIGVINVSKVNKDPEQDEIRLLYVISQLAAMSIKNASFYMKIKELAEVDALTKMFNNRFFKEFVDKECERSQQYGDQFTLLMSDIDHFKGFNDTFGHQVGDLVLAETAAEFSKACRPDIDIAARYGGEEFCLVLPKMGTEEGRQVADRVRQSVADKQFVLTTDLAESDTVKKAVLNPPGNAADGRPILQMHPDGIPRLHVTVSIGVSTYPVHATNRDFMVKKADEALYVAKESGRNQIQVAK